MPFTPQQIQVVWVKATVVANNDPNVFRKDTCGAWIRRSDYGNRNSAYGWEVDHVNPKGGDDTRNLQPLHWENNVAKGDGLLVCVIGSRNTENVRIR